MLYSDRHMSSFEKDCATLRFLSQGTIFQEIGDDKIGRSYRSGGSGANGG